MTSNRTRSTLSEGPHRCRAVAIAAALLAGVLIGTSAEASVVTNRRLGIIAPQPAGEAGRLLDRTYEAIYRSPNVYRSSRHFSPLDNPFRSSRYYQQKLASSGDAYHVRTYVHGSTRDLLVDHRLRYGTRRYGGVNSIYRPYGLPILTNSRAYSRPSNEQATLERRYDERLTAEAERRQRVHDALRRERENATSVLSAPPAEPASQTAVSERVTLPDGRVKIVITSVPADDD
ncbi:MAG: hypothetical protein KC983_05320 [Phycisphaerales bacterium]|nr:hypothetical protein [Phycisphaerales bacterium]